MTAASLPADVVRVIVDRHPSGGDWNMAVDQVLLESALQEGVCTLRWYRWQEPTLSLGYFQSFDDPLIDCRFAGLPVVRRLSGGGAILHDRELTYSCAIASGHTLAQRPAALYSAIHGAIVVTLRRLGIAVAPRGAAEPGLDASFLCFSRGDANDLVIAGHKVLGSAQRRRRGAVLQHGSLLLERSPVAPEHPGIADLSAIAPSAVDVTSLVAATAEILAAIPCPGGLTDFELDRVRQIVQSTPDIGIPGATAPAEAVTDSVRSRG